jgi:hypothetical protein
MFFHQPNDVDASGSNFFDIGGDQTTVNNVNVHIHLSLFGSGRRPRHLHTSRNDDHDMSWSNSGPDASPQESAPTGAVPSPATDLTVDTAVRLVVQITKLLVDRRGSLNTHRDLELKLKLLHQTLILTELAIQEYNDRLLGKILANTITPEVERCCIVLLELLDKVNCTRQGLASTSISNLWQPVFGSRWKGDELASLKTKLCRIQRSLGGFLMALNSCVFFVFHASSPTEYRLILHQVSHG